MENFWEHFSVWWFSLRHELKRFLREPHSPWHPNGDTKQLLLVIFYLLVRLVATIYGIWLTWYMLAFIQYVSHFAGMVVSAYDAVVCLFWYVMWRYMTFTKADKL